MSVTLVREPSVQNSGVITVSVPKGMAMAGSGFGFVLPAELFVGASTTTPAIVTTLERDPLPDWLQFNPETRAFNARAVPEGAFPFQILVTIAGKSTNVVISERSTNAVVPDGTATK